MEEEAESDHAGDISEQGFDRGKWIFVVNVRPLADNNALSQANLRDTNVQNDQANNCLNSKRRGVLQRSPLHVSLFFKVPRIELPLLLCLATLG